MGTVAITVVYTLLLFAPSPYSMFIYVVVASTVFIYFIYNAISRRMYEDTEDWQVTWSVQGGWKSVGKQSQPTTAQDVDILTQIDAWMKAGKPYCRTDFSANDIMKRFDVIDRATLTALLKSRDMTPPSYIRHCRIEEACRTIKRKEAVKVNKLASSVGFSHPTSFSRAFTAAMGETVTDYINSVGANENQI